MLHFSMLKFVVTIFPDVCIKYLNEGYNQSSWYAHTFYLLYKEKESLLVFRQTRVFSFIILIYIYSKIHETSSYVLMPNVNTV